MDSGADHLQLPEEILDDIGIIHDPEDGFETVLDASLCNVNFKVFKDVEVEIEGNKITVETVLSLPGVPALLGRTAFLSAIDVGFDDDGWLYK